MHTAKQNNSCRLEQVKIAVVAFGSLGDGLMYILLANNLRQNNFDVTYFGNIGYQLSTWLPNITILPYPEQCKMDQSLAHFDLVLMSPTNEQRARMAQNQEYLQLLKQRYMLICFKAPTTWVYDHCERLKQRLSPDLFVKVSAIAQASGSIKFRPFKDESVVDIFTAYMHEKLQLNSVTRTVAITAPTDLIFKRFSKRIIVSPDSAGPEDKNWGKNQFLQLCKALKYNGYEPVIIVSPNHHKEWVNLSQGKFETPLFESINQLAAYIYESAALIANDSGNGHLASFLGVPTVTIYKKRNHKFHWRPSWGSVGVVCPVIVISFFGFRIWRPFVTVNKILKVMHALLSLHKK